MNNTQNITNQIPEYYITPYTFLTIFSIFWVFTACVRALTMPFRFLYILVNTIIKIFEGILYIGRVNFNNGERDI